MSIVNSFELPSSDGSIDEGFFRTRRDQSVIGWYTVGNKPTAADSAVHAHVSELVDASPSIFLLFNPDIQDDAKQLPFAVFESALTDGTEADKAGKFVQLEVGVEAGEAERIAVDDVANESASDSDPSGQIASLSRQRNAIAMLHDRVRVIQQYVSAVVAGIAPADHEILRQCAALVATLPVMDGSEFNKELRTEYNDTQMVSYLTTLLGQLNTLSSVTDKHWALHPPQSEDMGMKHGLNPKMGGQLFGSGRRRGTSRR
ncbi:COP9 complex subunit 6 [Trichosporon asahii var. asahii CBS 8904]|uniref:COP9 complex subunit 6 n=2 Tax=Trichosporon asahii var. asahii TaxID=189963 RepID=K1WSI5_TRIAC|nr:COP9 complex subunit 6 [Trichosporon asahii var. asahii CBS 2479]EJT46784.1 COP9 complex subunit 6 [Trichosporon asahii var. asahii CBS 2479]EKD03944.1 COP9 complex subunit 6 [Trichosporon asahii var. asahii CBS 8904]